MHIERINSYLDPRFSQVVLNQHGAFLVEGAPYAVEITGRDSAVIRGENPDHYAAVIEEFRFFAEHITRFFDEKGVQIATFPPIPLFPVPLDSIQPSQFYVDRDKLNAVGTFIRTSQDIVVPLIPQGEGFISLDGHTRLAAAAALGFREVLGFLTESNSYIFDFVSEAQRRGIFTPYDLQILPHEAYQMEWDAYCDAYWPAKES